MAKDGLQNYKNEVHHILEKEVAASLENLDIPV